MKFHPLLKSKIKSWNELEKHIEQLPNTKEMGNVFEQFVYVYFLIKHNLYQIAEHYMEKDIPLEYRRRFNFERYDCGVDGLIIFKNGKSAAYQAKFRSDRVQPSYAELTKFWAEAKSTDYNYTVANCYYLSRLCAKQPKHLSILVDEFENLGSEFFNEFYLCINAEKPKRQLYAPDKFQQRMIGNVLKGFTKYNRGKLIAACGTGKTLTALWISELMKTQKVLFLAPSLALIKQTLESWTEQASRDFSYLCVCSDKTVSDEIDSGDIKLSDFNVPVTTSPNDICKYLSQKSEEKKIIFSTYQSLDVLSESINKLVGFTFDLIVFDEAHRTAGTKDSSLFSLALYDQNIPSKKRLFMTATERLIRPWILKKAKEFNRVVFSMDNPELYGPVFDRFNFGEAIQNKIISDYRIIVAGVKAKEVYGWIKSNKLLVHTESGSKEYFTYAQNIFRQIMLIKSMRNFKMKKCITFHSNIKNAVSFIRGVSSEDTNLRQVFSRLWPELYGKDLYLDHVNGTMSAGDRKERLDIFRDSKFGVISNARCLTEGVDVPIIDSVYFVNPRHSLIDIVQACGRALRKPRDKHDKLAYFIVPILIPDIDEKVDIINEVDFEMLHDLIQSLRDQDQRLSEWIDKINLSASQGKTYRFSEGSDSPIILNLPAEFNVKDFEKKLYLRIAEVNRNPTHFDYKTRKYGKTERKSEYKRIFKTLGDYSVESYKNNLVMPTIRKFQSKDQTLSTAKLKINHNNISHTERLGLIIKEKTGYKLSPLGIQLFEDKINFELLFKQQMLRYFSSDKQGGRILFPYRACLKILLEAKSINFIEFAFGLYSLIDSSEESIIAGAEDTKFLREKYPNLEILSETNKHKVLKELNKYFGTNFSVTDIWAKKTTINNQYIYFRNHLSLFNDFIVIDEKNRTMTLIKGKEKALKELLLRDSLLEYEKDETILKKKYIQKLIIFMLFSL
ncbi:MAG: DEAD/DEAH box helicase family protein [Candidatus Firestonebacteria bacterium]